MIYSRSLYNEKSVPKSSKVNLKMLFDLDTRLSHGLDVKKWKDQSFEHGHARFYLPGTIISKTIAKRVK